MKNEDSGQEFDTVIRGRDTCFYVVLVQRLIYLLALIPFYAACRRLLRNPIVCFLLVAYVAWHFAQYQSWILTEPLAISGVMVFFAWMIFYIQKSTIKSAISLPLFIFVLLMERPVFIYLLILFTAFLLLRLFISPDRKQSAWGLVSVLLVCLLIHGYSLLNKKNHGIYTLSSVSVANRFAIAYETNLYEKSEDREIVDYIKERQAEYMVYGHCVLGVDVMDHFGINRTCEFLNKVIKQNLFQYVLTNIKNMYWETGSYLFYFTWYYILGTLEFLFTVILWCSFKTFPWRRLGMWGLVVGMFFVMYQCGWDCHERIVIPVLPIIYVIGMRYLDAFAMVYNHSTTDVKLYLKETM